MKHAFDDDPATATDLKRLFLAARQLAPKARAAYLEQACRDNHGLRQAVEDLLRYDATEDGFLARPALEHLAAELAGAPSYDLVGQQLGPYRIEAELGLGGMGVVYRAVDQRLGRTVAIKVLPAEFTRDEERVRRFEREARTISALKHPNIVTLFELFSHEGRQLLVTEYVEGETLREALARRPLEWREAVRIATQVAAALAAAHSAGIIHRDIKPANVMRQTGQAAGHIKVLDFGIAKMHNHEPVTQATHEQVDTAAPQATAVNTMNLPTATGSILGTPGYLSPEQARFHPDTQADERTDVFSLGVLLYELLTGQLPFPGATVADKLNAVLSPTEAPDVREVLPNLPAALSAILSKALRKDPAQRYANGRALWIELEELTYDSAGHNLVKEGKQRRLLNANRLLTQFTVHFLSNPATRIPPAQLWTIARYANLRRGKPEREVVRRSWLSACWRVCCVAVPFGLLTLVSMAFLSVDEQWNEHIIRDGNTAAVVRVAYSHNGNWLVSTGRDRQTIIWDMRQLKKRATLREADSDGAAAAFSPEGQWLVTGTATGELIVWRADTLEEVKLLSGSPAGIINVGFSPDGRLLAVLFNKPSIAIWEVAKWRKIYDVSLILSGNYQYHSLVFSPDNKWLRIAAKVFLSLSNGQVKDYPTLDWFEGAAAISPEGSRFLDVTSGRRACFNRLTWPGNFFHSSTAYCEKDAHRIVGRAATFSPDGRLAATGADDIVLWDARTYVKLGRFTHSDNVWSLSFSPDGRSLVSGHGNGDILIWDVAARRLAANLNTHSDQVSDVAFTPDGKHLLTGSEEEGRIYIWRANGEDKEFIIKGKFPKLLNVSFSPNGAWAATSDENHQVEIWDMQRAERRATFHTSGGAGVMAITPDGSVVATSQKVFRVFDGSELANFEPFMSANGVALGPLAFTADGKYLARIAFSGPSVLVDTQTWQIVSKYSLPIGELTRVAFSPDGRQLVTGDATGVLRLWTTDPFQPIAVLGKHKMAVQAVAFSPDGYRVASASDDQTIALWDVRKRHFIKTIGTHTSPVRSVTFSPNGQQLLSGEQDHSVRLYTRQRALWGRKLD